MLDGICQYRSWRFVSLAEGTRKGWRVLHGGLDGFVGKLKDVERFLAIYFGGKVRWLSRVLNSLSFVLAPVVFFVFQWVLHVVN